MTRKGKRKPFTVILERADGSLCSICVECPRHLVPHLAAVNMATRSQTDLEPSDFIPLAVIAGHIKVEFV